MIICGWDPGTIKFGLTFMDVDSEGTILSVDINQVPILDYLQGDLNYPNTNYHTRYREAIRCIDSMMSALPTKPIVFVYEIPHFDNKSPNSYGILVHHISSVIEHIEEAYSIPTVGYRPYSIKKTIGATKKLPGEKSKEAVLRCMEENTELCNIVPNNISCYGEDAIDSLLIAYTYLEDNR